MNRLFFIPIILLFSTSANCQDPVDAKIVDDGKSLNFQIEGKPVFSYNYQTVEPPKGIDKVYRRSGYIHPIYSPNGSVVTDDFSDDHAHQHGVFFAFVKAKTGDAVVDFWNQHSKKGTVEHFQVDLIDDRKQSAQVRLHHIQLVPTKSAKSKPTSSEQNEADSLKSKTAPLKRIIFEETWTISATKQLGCFVIELRSDVKNVTPETILIQKNHYGSFGIRGAGAWRKPTESQLQFLTSTGKNRKNGNQSPESWAAMSGKVDQQRCGVAVICSKQNVRYPQPVRLHPTMPYFSFAPMATVAFEIKSSEVFRSKYRIVSFDGSIDPKSIERLTDF